MHNLLTCKCCSCKSKRGDNIVHRLDCNCFVCRGKRGERKGEKQQHKIDCVCYLCKAARGECKGQKASRYGKLCKYKGKPLKHKFNCFCGVCKSKRGEIQGENSPNWINGRSYEPYPMKFNDKLKELIRERDKCTCQLCSKTQENNGRKLDVHHIDYNKDNCDFINLIALCRCCNAAVNKNREKWTKYF